jgi:ribosome-associated toxin RatA of RatAB toxin-antitoxin module
MVPGVKYSWVTLGVAVTATVVALLVIGPAAAQEGFSAGERARLAAGQLVTRAQERDQGDQVLIGGTAWQVINAPPEAVWRAVLDTQRYPNLLPQVVEARNVRQNEGERTIYVHHRHGVFDGSYYLNVQYQPEQRSARFQLDKTRENDIQEAWGFMTVHEYGGGKSLLSFGIMADVGSGLITGLVRPQVHEWMLRVPQTIRRELEGGGGYSRYVVVQRDS